MYYWPTGQWHMQIWFHNELSAKSGEAKAELHPQGKRETNSLTEHNDHTSDHTLPWQPHPLMKA